MNDPGAIDVKLRPAYPLAAAARYLGSHPSTLRAWLHGRTYNVGKDVRHSPPALAASQEAGMPISFLDLAEAHILLTIRRGCHIPMRRFRDAMDFMQKELQGDWRRLAHRDFRHDHRDLFILKDGKLLSLSERGQYVDEVIIAEGLKQLDYGNDDYVSRFFPRFEGRDLQKQVMLDPTVNFGHPCLADCGVGVEAIAVRFRAGETMAQLAEDYGIPLADIEEAIRWHDRLAA